MPSRHRYTLGGVQVRRRERSGRRGVGECVRSGEDEVLAANEAFYAAFAARDLGAMDALWSRQEGVTCIHPGWNALVGREEVMASWEAILGNPAQPRIVVGGARAGVLGDTAIVTCRELVAGNPLIATNVFVREDGRWRLLHHHAGPVLQVET